MRRLLWILACNKAREGVGKKVGMDVAYMLAVWKAGRPELSTFALGHASLWLAIGCLRLCVFDQLTLERGILEIAAAISLGVL